MTTTDHAIVAPAVTGDPGTRADAGGFDPGRPPFQTRDGREVPEVYNPDREGHLHGWVRNGNGSHIGGHWDKHGKDLGGHEWLDLVNVGVRPAAPDPIPQPEGDAPPAPAQSAGAAADGEDDAAGLTQADIDHAQALLDDRRGTHQTLTMVRHMLDFVLARPHEPADASARSARGEVAEAVLAERARHVEHIRVIDAECVALRAELARRRDLETDQVWFWQDTNNCLDSIACQVVIKAEDLRALLNTPTPAAVLDRTRPAGQSEGEPAAWQWRNSREDFWHFAAKEDRAAWEASLYKFGEYRALYAAPPSAAAAPPAPASRVTSAPAQDAGPAGVTEAWLKWRDENLYLDRNRPEALMVAFTGGYAAARARTPDAGKETGR